MKNIIIKYWAQIALAVTLIVGAIKYYVHMEKDSLESRTFKTTEEYVRNMDHLNSVPSPAKKAAQDVRDSINTATAVEFRKNMQKAVQDLVKGQRYQDSINRLNADQMYQIKQILNHEQ